MYNSFLKSSILRSSLTLLSDFPFFHSNVQPCFWVEAAPDWTVHQRVHAGTSAPASAAEFYPVRPDPCYKAVQHVGLLLRMWAAENHVCAWWRVTYVFFLPVFSFCGATNSTWPPTLSLSLWPWRSARAPLQRSVVLPHFPLWFHLGGSVWLLPPNAPADKGVQRRRKREGLPCILPGGSPWQHQRVPVQPVCHQDDQHRLQWLQTHLWIHGQMQGGHQPAALRKHQCGAEGGGRKRSERWTYVLHPKKNKLTLLWLL